MKRILGISLLIMTLLLAAAGCTQTPPPAEAQWTIVIEAGGETFEFTDIDAAEMTAVVVETSRTDRDGNVLDQTWTGAPLQAVLAAKGITVYAGAVVEASDGYSKEYSAEIMDNADTIVAWLLDGEEMDEAAGGPVQMIPKGEANNMYIKNLSKIIIQ